jgi:hypothetical protein
MWNAVGNYHEKNVSWRAGMRRDVLGMSGSLIRASQLLNLFFWCLTVDVNRFFQESFRKTPLFGRIFSFPSTGLWWLKSNFDFFLDGKSWSFVEKNGFGKKSRLRNVKELISERRESEIDLKTRRTYLPRNWKGSRDSDTVWPGQPIDQFKNIKIDYCFKIRNWGGVQKSKT